MKRKRIRIILISVALVLSFTGCSAFKKESTDSETSAKESVEETTQASTEEATVSETTEQETLPIAIEQATENSDIVSDGELEVSYTGKTKEIGNDEYGYMQVPEEWVKFHDVEDDGTANMYQYSSMDTISVVTMSYMENFVAKTIADMYYESYTNDPVEGLSAAKVKLDGREAYQIYAYYTDVNKMMVSWIFDGDDGNAHVLSIETQDYDIISLSGTYKLNK
jgi:flagellar biosynthesis component FlhA